MRTIPYIFHTNRGAFQGKISLPTNPGQIRNKSRQTFPDWLDTMAKLRSIESAQSFFSHQGNHHDSDDLDAILQHARSRTAINRPASTWMNKEPKPP
jgi:hypothetical protein